MKPTLDDILNGVPEQSGNGGKPLSPTTPSKGSGQRAETQLEKISASAKRLLAEEAEQREDKVARLSAARRAQRKIDKT